MTSVFAGFIFMDDLIIKSIGFALALGVVIDAFLVEVDRLDRLDLNVATEFLLIASTLVELKARRLLPGADATELDEELMRFEERDLLLARLLECKTFKDVSQVFGRLADDAGRCVPRQVGPDERFADLAPDLLTGVTPMRLRDAAVTAFTPKPVPRIDLFHVAPVRVSVADALVELVEELPGIGRITFARLTAALGERMQAFDKIILGVGKVKTNDAIDIDFLPGRGVVLSVNGKPRGAPVPGDDLYAALLRIFLGDKPADPELKQGLLGAPL